MIGLQIVYPAVTWNQVYRLDNFVRYYNDDDPRGDVPEPGTYAALGTALLSLGATFRRRITGVIGGLKGRLAA